jgi:hypothetical protein
MTLVALMLGAISPSLAETPEQRQACTDDAFRVCGDAIPDQDRVFRCLVQNNAAISPLCRSALAPYIQASEPTAPASSRSTAKSKIKRSSKSATSHGKGPVNLNPPQ